MSINVPRCRHGTTTRTGFTPPETSELPASPAPSQDIWVRSATAGSGLRSTAEWHPCAGCCASTSSFGIEDWRTLVSSTTLRRTADLRPRMEAAAEAVATQTRGCFQVGGCPRVSLVVFADADTAYYTYNGHGAIVFRVHFNPSNYSDAVVHELSHASQFHGVGGDSGERNAAP